jgi:hypothetical protein
LKHPELFDSLLLAEKIRAAGLPVMGEVSPRDDNGRDGVVWITERIRIVVPSAMHRYNPNVIRTSLSGQEIVSDDRHTMSDLLADIRLAMRDEAREQDANNSI